MNHYELAFNMIASVIIGLPIMLICNHMCSTPKPIKIYIWIQKRYDYYDKLFGASYGDKYTKQVFEDASGYFDMPLYMLNDLYWKGCLAFTDRQQKRYEKRENKRLANMEKKNRIK